MVMLKCSLDLRGFFTLMIKQLLVIFFCLIKFKEYSSVGHTKAVPSTSDYLLILSN